MEGILKHIIEQLITTIFRKPVVSPTTTSRGAATYAPRAIWATFDAVWTKWTMPQTFMVIFFKHDDFAPKCNRNIINHLQVIFRGSLGVPFDILPGYHRQLKKTSPSSTSSLTKRSFYWNKCHDLHRIGLFAKEIASLSHPQKKFGREITSPRSPQNKVA